MVEIEGSEAVKRRVSKKELLYVDAQENQRVETVLVRLDRARLIVGGDEAGEPYIEPAHDYLVRGWDKLQDWIQQEQETLLLQRLLVPAAKNWHQTKRDLWNGNSRLTLLKQIRKSRDNWLNQLELLFVQSSVNRKRLNIGARLGFVGLVVVVGAVSVMKSDAAFAKMLQALSAVKDNLDETAEQLQYVSAQKAEYKIQYDETVEDLEAATMQVGQAQRATDAAKAQAEEQQQQTEEAKKETLAAAKLAQDNYVSAQRNAVNQFSATAKLFMRDRKPVEAMAYAIKAADISRSEALWAEEVPPSNVPVNLLNVIESNLERNVFTVPMVADSETIISNNVELDNIPSERAVLENAAYASAITSDGKTIMSSDHQGQLLFFQANSSSDKPTKVLRLPDGVAVRDILTTEKEAFFVWLENAESATIARVEKENESFPEDKSERFESESRLVSVAIAADGQTIAIVNQAETLTVLDRDFNELWSKDEIGLDAISRVAISPNGEVVVVAGTKDDDPQVQIWTHKIAEKDSDKTLENTVFLAQDALKAYTAITAVTISPDGQNILLVGDDTADYSHIEVWDLAGSKRTHQPMRTVGKINRLSVTKGGTILATVPDPNDALFNRSDVHLWSIEGKRLLDKTVDGDVKDAAIALDGRTIVLSSVANNKNTLHVWEGSQRQTVTQVAKYYRFPEAAAERSGTEVSSVVPPALSAVNLTSAFQGTAGEIDTSDRDLLETFEQEKTTEDALPKAENSPETKSSNEDKTATDNEGRAETKAGADEAGPSEFNLDDTGSEDTDATGTSDVADSDIEENVAEGTDSVEADTKDVDSEDADADGFSDTEPDGREPEGANDAGLKADEPEGTRDAESETDEPKGSSNTEPELDKTEDKKADAEQNDDDKGEETIPDGLADDETLTDESDGLSSADDAEEVTPNSNELNDNDASLHLALQALLADAPQTLIAVSSDGQTVAIGKNTIVDGQKKYRLSIQNDSSVELSVKEEDFFSQSGEIHSLSISEAENDESPQRVAIMLKSDRQKSDNQDTYNVKVFDVKTRKFLADPLELEGSQVLVEISPDGRTLVSATTQEKENGKYNNEVKLWEIVLPEQSSGTESEPTIRLKASSPSTAGEISALAISTDGTRLMTAHNKAFDDTALGYKFGGKGSLTVWDIPSAEESSEAGGRDLIKKKTFPAGGYISAIALASIPEEVALIIHPAKRVIPVTGKGKHEEFDARHITSEVKTWTWEGQPTSQTLRLDGGKLMQFVGLMPDGENIVVAGHEVVRQAGLVGGSSSLRPTIRLFNKQRSQLFDIDWAAAIGTHGVKSTDEKQNTQDKLAETLGNPDGSQERLTALVVADDGKHIFSTIRHTNQQGLIRWNLAIDNLLQASCEQIKHHPILHKPAAESSIGKEARDACNRLSRSEDKS